MQDTNQDKQQPNGKITEEQEDNQNSYYYEDERPDYRPQYNPRYQDPRQRRGGPYPRYRKKQNQIPR